VKGSDQTNLVRHYRVGDKGKAPSHLVLIMSLQNRLRTIGTIGRTTADEIALPLMLITASDHGRRGGGGSGDRAPPSTRPVAAPFPQVSPGLSGCSSDRHLPGWNGLLAHYWECTAPEKRVRSKLHYALFPSRFRLRSIVAKVFDFRLRFDNHLITMQKRL